MLFTSTYQYHQQILTVVFLSLLCCNYCQSQTDLPKDTSCLSQPCKNNGTCSEFLNGTELPYHCECTENGYFGEECDKRNPCFFENNCQNGGICSRLTDELHSCYCLEGYHGLACEYVDACSQNPCQAGSCERLRNNYRCHCFDGFDGSQCEERDPCILDNKCLNFARCVRKTNFESKCVCEPEFTGEYCQYHNACYLKSPCQNAGSCTTDLDGFLCACAPGFFGSRCQERDPCILQNIQCLNGGKCERLNSRIGRCICPESFVGETCSMKRPCSNSPCRNQGFCKVSADGLGSSCQCPYGFSGDICQTRDPCLLDGVVCQNGGSCIRLNNLDAKCSCPSPYFGPTCELREYCFYTTCSNGGTCLSLQEQHDFKCLCPKGYAGKSCEFKDFCSSIFAGKCLNDGTCVNQQEEVTIKCYCPRGYMGTYCQHRDPCQLDGLTCINGYCERLRDDLAHCVCDSNFHGQRCEFLKACSSSPCENGGRCESIGNNYVCKCPVGYRGRNCEKRCPECLAQYQRHYGRVVLVKKTHAVSLGRQLKDKEDFCLTKYRHSCWNGGVCVNSTADSFQCKCTGSWSGNDCSIEDYSCSSLKCVHGSKSRSLDGSSCFCSCMAPYAGSLCTLKDPCQGQEGKHRCENGGTCHSAEDGTYFCKCRPGYFGSFCGQNDPCQLDGENACKNGGTCKYRAANSTYFCECKVPFAEPNCDKEDWCKIEPGQCIKILTTPRCFPCNVGQTCSKLGDSSYACTPAQQQPRSIRRRKDKFQRPHFYRPGS